MIKLNTNVKKTAISLSLLITLAGSNTQAISYAPTMDTIKNTAKAALLVSIFYSAYDCYTRKATNDAVSYNIDELLAGTNVAGNIQGLWRDGVWGHTGKSTALKVDEEGYVVADATKINPKGLVGNLIYNWKAIAGAMGTAWLVKIMLEALCDSSSNESLFDRFARVVTSKANALGLKLIPQAANTIAELAK